MEKSEVIKKNATVKSIKLIILLSSVTIFQHYFFQNILSGITSESQIASALDPDQA